MSLKDRILKASTIKESAVLAKSKLFAEKDIISIEDSALMNIALSGDIDGGMTPGILQIAAESMHFKSKFALAVAKSFTNKFPDGAILFYDSEYGTPDSYFNDFSTENVIHTPVLDLEQFKIDIMAQLKSIELGDKLLIIVDSMGNIPSLKEVEDTDAGKTVGDMSRAKQMKSVFRMIMPRINQKEVYVVIINHTYKTQEMYSKDVPNGGTGSVYNSNIIWTITKAQEKGVKKSASETFSEIEEDDKGKGKIKKEKKKASPEEVIGYQFTINIFKSRFVIQGSKIPILVTFEGGIQKWAGMLDLAMEAEYILKPDGGISYVRKDKPEEKYRRKDIENNNEFWESFINETDFNDWVKKKFRYK